MEASEEVDFIQFASDAGHKEKLGLTDTLRTKTAGRIVGPAES